MAGPGPFSPCAQAGLQKYGNLLTFPSPSAKPDAVSLGSFSRLKGKKPQMD